MSVLIKGMKMPKNCLWCPLQYMGFCQVTKTDVISDLGRRADDCPIVELPEKHGRLIDADAVIKELAKAIPYIIDDDVTNAYVEGLGRAKIEIEDSVAVIEPEGEG